MMIPKGWSQEQLRDVIDGSIKNGYSPLPADKITGLWVLGLGALQDGSLNEKEIKPAPDNEKVRGCLLENGDFLISRSNTPEKVGRVAVFRDEIKNCSYPDLMMRLKIDDEKASPGYMEHVLKSYAVRSYFRRSAAGSSGSMIKINKSIVEKTSFLLPPKSEQKRIACILSTWDEAITTTERLLEASQRQKLALMQQLLIGKRRLPGFEGEWLEPIDVKEYLESKRVATQNGGEIIAIESYDRGTTNASVQIKRLKDKDLSVYGETRPLETEEPQKEGEEQLVYRPGFDALFLPGHPNDVAFLSAQLAYYDIKIPLLGSNSWNHPDLLKWGRSTLNGSIFGDAIFLKSTNLRTQKFIRKYREQFQIDPSIFAVQAYDAMRIILDAISHGATNGKEIRDQFLVRYDLPTIGGLTSFGESGVLDRKVYMIQVANGRFIQIN